MAEPLFISEGHIVNQSGDRIATLTELAESERITALEERLSALENAARPEPEETPENPDELSPPGGPLKIHVQPEDTIDGEPVAAPLGVSAPGSPADVAGTPEGT
jgi:hypothetical protein